MEHDVVLSDEVYETCILVLPPLLPCTMLLGVLVAQLLCVGDISDRGVEPYIENLAVSTLHGYRDTPVKVTCHGARLQVHVEPTLALAIYVWTPLLVVLKNPLLQPLLVFVEWQIPVLCLFKYRRFAGLL